MMADMPVASEISRSDAESAMRRRGDGYLRSVLDAIAAFAGVLDVDGVLLEANAPALTLAQLSPADVIGRRFD